MTYSAEVLADSPLAYWRLGDSSGTTMTDSGGSARNGTYQNAPALGQSSLIVTDAANTAVQFLAAGTKFATVTNASWMNFNGDFTVECWVKPAVSVTGATARQYVAKYNTAAGGNGLYLCIDTAGKPTFGLRFAGTDVTIVSSGSAVTLGDVYHIVGVRSGTTSTLYVNGVSMGSSTNSGNPAADASTLAVGALSGVGQYADATIDEVAFYNTALSVGRVQAHYQAATAITVVGEVASAAATALSGSALTAISVAGEAAVSAASALDGSASTGPVTVNGEVASVLVTALDGVALVAILVVGDVASLSAQANDGSLLIGPVPGSVAVINLTALDGGIAFDTTTDTSNVFGGRSRGGTATVELTVPVVEPIGVATTRVDKAVPLPLPVLVKGRPT